MMRRTGLLLLVGTLIFTGCVTAPTPTATPTSLPLSPSTETPTPGGPTETPTPTATIPPPTPFRLPTGYGQFEADRPFIVGVTADQPSQRIFRAIRLSAYTITVTPQSADLDIRISLLDPRQNALAVVNRGEPGAAETITEISLPLTGDYELRVEAVAGAGDVTGEIASLVPELQTGGGMFDPPIEVPDRMTAGAFRSSDVFHSYTVELRSSEVVVFELETDTPGLNLAFTLYDPDYLSLGTFSTEGTAYARSDEIYVPFDGTYMLFVQNLGEGTGAYVLRVVAE